MTALWAASWLGMRLPAWALTWAAVSGGIGLLWAVCRARAKVAEERRRQEAVNALHAEIWRTELSSGVDAAGAVVRAAYEGELRDLSESEAQKAAELRTSPLELARFLQKLSERPPQ